MRRLVMAAVAASVTLVGCQGGGGVTPDEDADDCGGGGSPGENGSSSPVSPSR